MNILGLNPFSPQPIEFIVNEILSKLKKFHSEEHPIEIQFKYAQFVSFFDSYYSRQNIPNPEVRRHVFQICNKYVIQQSSLHLVTLQKLSNRNLVLLNDLGRGYRLYSGFNEKKHKMFYKMKEFLVKLCKQNESNNHNELNFYYEMQRQNENKTFRFINPSELRLDLNVKNGEESARYTYQVGKSIWLKTQKEDLCPDFDLMLSARTFRLGIKKEDVTKVSHEEVLDILTSENVQRKQGSVFLRLKRALRVSKNNEIQISLSEVFQPENERRIQFVQDIKDILGGDPDSLDEFCINTFQQFYMWEVPIDRFIPISEHVSKFEIQSQFLPAGIKKILYFQKENRFKDLFKYIEVTLQDLYSLMFTEDKIKRKQTNVTAEMIRNNTRANNTYPECRLNNQFGTYMHDLVHEYMNQ